ncbi:MAG: hypothetical protein AB7U82_33575 [Blastocatellales bacterium]
MPTLQFQGGSIGLEVEVRYARLQCYCKAGRAITTLTGHTQGTRHWRLRYQLLQDRAANLLDQASSTLKTDFDYLWDFYQARRLDGSAFDLADALTGATVSVRFEDYELTPELFSDALYSIDGVPLRAARAATLT